VFDQVFSQLNLTLGILLITSIFFVQGRVRSDLIALCALLFLVLFGILEPSEALAGFSNSVVLMMVGLFIVGAAIFRTGLAKMISSRLLQLAGTNEGLLLVLVMLVTALIGTFVSNTGTVAVMMPIVVSMAASAQLNPRRYLMPLAFASSMAMFTLISTPPNMVIQEILVGAGYQALGFFSFAPIGLIGFAVGLVFLFFASKLLVSPADQSNAHSHKGRSLAELVEEYNLRNQSYKLRVPNNSSMLGKSLADLQIRARYGVTIGKIVKQNHRPSFGRRNETSAGPRTIIESDDILYCYGPQPQMDQFINESGCELLKHRELSSNMQEFGFAEVFIMPNSRLINHSIAEIRFREEFNVMVLGIQRQNEYLSHIIKDIPLRAGDAMLIHGKWQDIAKLADRQQDLVLVGQPLKEAAKVTLDQNAPIAGGIMLLMVLAMVFNIVPAVIAVLTAAVAMIITGCLRNMEEAYGSINWESVVLIAAMLPMSTAFEKTGAAMLISDSLVQALGNAGPYALLAGVYAATSLLTLFISNTATAVLFAPIALQAAIGMQVNPYPFLFAVAVGASMCFASPFSTPPNALVMNAGRYSFFEYIKVGLPLQILMGVVMVISLPLLFPF
jgi:di/tricarboxylate transporter